MGKAIVLVVVAVVVAVLLLHHQSKSTVASATTAGKGGTTATTVASTKGKGSKAAAPTTTTTTVAVTPPSQVKLKVLNGVLTGNLATEESATLKANPGYDTLAPDNATTKVTSSAIYVLTAGDGPEGLALAATLGLPASDVVTSVPANAPIPAVDKAQGPDLVLVIGPDLASKIS
jgi:LytR cell envelope-related transcriptional attenuator